MTWLRIARVAAPVVVLALLLAALLWTRSVLEQTRQQRDSAVADVAEFRQLVTDATVPAGEDGKRALLSTPDARAALVGAIRDRDDARGSLARIDRDTKAAKVRDVAADAALGREQAANARQYAAARPRIDALATAKPSGEPDADAAAIDTDSKAAWEAWK